MLKNARISFTLAVCLFFLLPVFGQNDCHLKLSGKIEDTHNGIGLDFATIYIVELNKAILADSAGLFSIDHICAGTYTLKSTHVGCDPAELILSITQDTTVSIHQEHHVELLQAVSISGKKSTNSSENTVTLANLEKDSYKNLASVLESLMGVRSLNTGSQVSKPIINGMFGNRVVIMNNGIRQEDQQWGNEHAPLIDPFSMNELVVIKGANSLQYGGDAVGGVILSNQTNLNKIDALHSRMLLSSWSNGRGMQVAYQVQSPLRTKPLWKFQLQSNLRISGDKQAPGYVLSNTGYKDASFSATAFKSVKNKSLQYYYSYFLSNIGILRASHIGSLTDLEYALEQKEPFYIAPFSYRIDSPHQLSQHHLLKVEYKNWQKDNHLFSLRLGTQFNQRQEFDVRRGGRSDIPVLDLGLVTENIGFDNQFFLKKNLTIKNGIEATYQLNYNVPGTGVRPLIPYYQSGMGGIYNILQKKKGISTYEMGIRYDYKAFTAKTIDPSGHIIAKKFAYHSANANIGYAANFDHFIISAQVGTAYRPPAINELLSDGVHQGTASIEFGNLNLKAEQSIKNQIGARWTSDSKKWDSEVSGFAQYVNNYIFLKPGSAPLLTIRGAFPTFYYMQTNALLYGCDAKISYTQSSIFDIAAKCSYLVGDDVGSNERLSLLYIPPMRAEISGEFSIASLMNDWQEYHPKIAISCVYNAKQNHILPSQDYAPVPENYTLVGIVGKATVPLSKNALNISLIIDNLFNTSYRDYLNRLRYFANEPGRNFIIQLSYKI
ncbi:MAG: TonB-dependent receptor [Saprospiraceae bacterium]|nr:TonB-dependent receptor [Saprospiraceae bacterium]